MANQMSNHFKYLLAGADINFPVHTFKIILMRSGFTFDSDNDSLYANVSNDELPTGNGYTLGGKTLTGKVVTKNDLDNYTEITWSNISWTASGGPIGPASGAIIYDNNPIGKPVIGFIDFGADYTQENGGVMTLQNLEVRIS